MEWHFCAVVLMLGYMKYRKERLCGLELGAHTSSSRNSKIDECLVKQFLSQLCFTGERTSVTKSLK